MHHPPLIDGRRPTPGAENRALTGLRGLAACFVITLHFFAEPDSRSLVQTIIRHGYIAVDLFFVLSGYVMALTYAASFTRPWTLAAYAGFLGKRLARIYPLYLAILLFGCALLVFGLAEGGLPGAVSLAANGAMLQAWGLADSIVGPTWSISTEWAVYLAFPALVAATLGGGPGRLGLVALGALALLVLVATRSDAAVHQVYGTVVARDGPLDVYGAGTVWPLLRCLGGFLLGLLAYRVARPTRPTWWGAMADPLALLLAALLLAPWADLLIVPACAVLVVALASGPSLVHRALSVAPVHGLGVVSYSMYLVHRPLETAIRHPLMDWFARLRLPHAYTLSGAAVFAATLLVSLGTFALIERPARRLARRAMHARPRPIEAEPAAP